MSVATQAPTTYTIVLSQSSRPTRNVGTANDPLHAVTLAASYFAARQIVEADLSVYVTVKDSTGNTIASIGG